MKVVLDTFDDKKVRIIMILKIYTTFNACITLYPKTIQSNNTLKQKNELANIISNEPLAMKNNYVVHLRPSRLDV